MAGHAFVRVAAGEHGAAKGAAEREAGKVLGEVDSVSFGALKIRGAGVGVSVLAEGLGAELIGDDPDHVGMRGQRWVGYVVSGGRTGVLLAGSKRGTCGGEEEGASIHLLELVSLEVDGYASGGAHVQREGVSSLYVLLGVL